MCGDREPEGIFPVEFDRMLRHRDCAGSVFVRILRPTFSNTEIEPPPQIGWRLGIRRIEQDGTLEEFSCFPVAVRREEIKPGQSLEDTVVRVQVLSWSVANA